MGKIKILILVAFFTCCSKIKIVDGKEKITQSYKVPIQYRFDFPDTVYVKDKYDGKLLYESHYDSITAVFTDKEKDRYVFLATLVTDNIDYDFTHLKSIVKDTFGATDNKEILLRDISFPYKGVFYIDGVITDEIYIDLHRKDEQGEGLSRWLKDEGRVTKKVVVIEKNN